MDVGYDLNTHNRYLRSRGRATVGGVIYLHDITQDRFNGTGKQNLDLFKALCGNDAFEKVAIVTSKWDRVESVDREAKEKHEAEFKTGPWDSMIQRGTEVHQWNNDESPLEIIDGLLKRSMGKKLVLCVQEEMVGDKKHTGETEVGRKWVFLIEEEIKRKEAELEKTGNDQETKSELKADIERLKKEKKGLKNSFF
jgi:hypothetical protein